MAIAFAFWCCLYFSEISISNGEIMVDKIAYPVLGLSLVVGIYDYFANHAEYESIWDYINSFPEWQGVPFIPWAIFMLVVWIIADALPDK